MFENIHEHISQVVENLAIAGHHGLIGRAWLLDFMFWYSGGALAEIGPGPFLLTSNCV